MKTRRILKSIGLAAAATIALAGCIKMDMNLDLQSDDTVDGAVTIGVSKQLAELSGQDTDSLVDQMQSEFLGSEDELGEVRAEPYEDDDFVGSTMHFEGAPLSQFGGGGEESIDISRDGDEFVVSGVMDLTDESAEMDMSMLGGAMDVSIAITFPGDVASHNGELEGRTVTWTPRIGERVEIDARGSAVDGGGGGLSLAVIGIALAVLALIAVALILVLRGRGKSEPAGSYGAALGGEPAAAPGVVGGATVAGAPVPPAGATAGEPPIAVPPVTAPPADAPAATTPPAPAPPSTIPPAETPAPPASPTPPASPEEPSPGTPPPPPVG